MTRTPRSQSTGSKPRPLYIARACLCNECRNSVLNWEELEIFQDFAGGIRNHPYDIEWQSRPTSYEQIQSVKDYLDELPLYNAIAFDVMYDELYNADLFYLRGQRLEIWLGNEKDKFSALQKALSTSKT